MDAAAFADWLTLDERLRRAIKAREKRRAAAATTDGDPAADSTPTPPEAAADS